VKKFLYYILKPDGRSGKVVNGVVTYSGQPSPLPQTPNGWQQLLLEWSRSADKHGLISKASLPFGLVRDAAKIVRDGMYKETIETKLLILIQRLEVVLTLTTFNFLYSYFYRAEIDLSKVEDGLDMLNVPLNDNSVSNQLEAAWDTVVDIPVDSDPEAVLVKMDGIKKEYTKNYDIPSGQQIYGTADFYLGMTGLPSEGTNPNIGYFDIPLTVATAYPNTDYFSAVAALSQQVIITGTVSIYFDKSVSPVLRIETNISGGFPQYELIPFATAEPAGTIKTYIINSTVTIPAGDKLNMKIFGGNPVDPTTQFTVVGGSLTLKTDYRQSTTYIKALKHITLFERIISKIVPSATISSDLLTVSGLVYTTGDAIRGLPGSILSTSISDFFQDANSTFMAGIDVIENNIEIEGRVKYYDTTEVTDLGNVIELIKRPANEYMANTYKFGHKKQDIEDINGKFDPNGNNLFTGPRQRKNEYNMVSDYKAGPYEIEDLRLNLEGKTTTDNNSDKDIFVIAATGNDTITANVTFSEALGGMVVSNPDGFLPGQQIRITGSVNNDGVYDISSVVSILVAYVVQFVQPVADESTPVSVTIDFLLNPIYTLTRPVYSTIEGVPDTIFNLAFLTPKTMLFAHKRWIAGMNAGLGSSKIKFSSGKENQNTSLKTVLAGFTTDEDKDEAISSFGEPMFLPWYFIFKTEVPVSLPELLEDNPNRCFKFTDEYGNDWTGFLIMAGIAPNEYTAQEFKLLAAPGQDLTKLIH
jgi:hypothetical protein